MTRIVNPGWVEAIDDCLLLICHLCHFYSFLQKPIVIEDFKGNLNEVVLEKGDVLLYESSKCFHGRPMRFEGEWYSQAVLSWFCLSDTSTHFLINATQIINRSEPQLSTHLFRTNWRQIRIYPLLSCRRVAHLRPFRSTLPHPTSMEQGLPTKVWSRDELDCEDTWCTLNDTIS